MTIPMSGRRVALIGGAGFIGHNLALRLKALGADVQVIDGLQVNNLVAITSNVNNLPNQRLYLRMIQERLHLLEAAQIPLHVQDARDYSALSKLLDTLKPQVIVQLAAISHANRANKDPHSTFDHSLRTLENALDYARNRIEHFVYLSSSMVYGNFAEGQVAEDTPCSPLGIYGALKFAGEKMVVAYNQVFDLPYTIVRPSALYGERCVSRRVGQVFIENALQGLDITVNGDGSDKLDFTYIGDLVNGLVKVIENERSRGETFNLTYGQGRSINEMAEILRGQFQNINLVQNPRDRLMPERGTLSVEKARRLLGYDPQWPLDKGFVEYIKWYRHLFDSDASLRKAG